MPILNRGLRKFLNLFVGKPKIKSGIVKLAKMMQIDLLQLAYNNIGILNYQDYVVGGEQYVLDNVLPLIVPEKDGIIFDVGANVGEISLMLAKKFPTASIYAFEPNPVTFDLLKNNLEMYNNIVSCINFGLGDSEGSATLHCYSEDQSSGHASIYRDVFGLYKNFGISAANDLTKFSFKITTIDQICKKYNISRIDFIKIDVEGHELSVLRGGAEILGRCSVRAIQFEFTDCNAISRVFMKDFYDFLPGYAFYRLHREGLIALGPYAARHEIFQYQNILALHEEMNTGVFNNIEAIAIEQ